MILMNSYKNKLHMLACDHASDMDNRNFKDFCYDYLDTILSSNPTLFLMEVALAGPKNQTEVSCNIYSWIRSERQH